MKSKYVKIKKKKKLQSKNKNKKQELIVRYKQPPVCFFSAYCDLVI